MWKGERRNIVSRLAIIYLAATAGSFHLAIQPAMYLLTYPSLRRRHKGPPRLACPILQGTDFITPDGKAVPRPLGEAALLRHTAALVGGILVGSF